MSLASLIKTKTKVNTSSKTPQFYNAERAAFIIDMTIHENEAVRIAACSNKHCPAKILQARLLDEEDRNVIKAILMNCNLPKKAILEFATKDHRSKMFDNDDELIAYVDSLNLEQ